MKNTHRNTLLAALLVCLAPAAASAAEGYLTPATNNGSGYMPSGYTKLYFELGDGDWAAKLKLPGKPQQADHVVLSSLSSKYATLDAGKTAFADQVYLPVHDLSNIELRWTASSQRWDVVGGESARVVYGRNQPSQEIESSNHLVTQVGLYDTKRATSLGLPAWAPQGAVLVIANGSSNDVQVRPSSLAGNAGSVCNANQNCGFVYAADGKWHARQGHARVAAQAQLPAPTARWNDVFLGDPAEDIGMQPTMRLPAQGVEGDIYQITNLHGARFTRVLADHTDMPSGIYVTSAHRLVLRYDSARGLWIRQALR
ncbi:hypothetical protein GPNADHDJ_00307 [Stenotrophomonas maltophilia]|uniref:Metalloprotease StcE beta-sandwich domain-containing protein n=1 Tax=Stenotrophomonas maltophilia TaxID=40324 RepID=A0AAX1I7K7_STEMA|nr:hypothetical protein [Stenotrophomonas maltophilia]QGL80490.1 hypothetical protein FEO94_10685 [Stenotrophomonas maltophilia]QNG76140.1 hypothetical protein GPNADHDJ_00307 [Stenotrophomonas maltophilia]